MLTLHLFSIFFSPLAVGFFPELFFFAVMAVQKPQNSYATINTNGRVLRIGYRLGYSTE